MSTKNLITTNGLNKTQMIITLVKQVEILEQELAKARAGVGAVDTDDATLRYLIASVAAGHLIESVKAVRDMTGLGLKEAKDLVVESAGIKLQKVA